MLRNSHDDPELAARIAELDAEIYAIPENRMIFKGIMENDIDEIRVLIKGGYDINSTINDTIHDQNTHIEWILIYGQIDALRFFIENGYDFKKPVNKLSQLDCIFRSFVTVARVVDAARLLLMINMIHIIFRQLDSISITLAKDRLMRTYEKAVIVEALRVFDTYNPEASIDFASTTPEHPKYSPVMFKRKSSDTSVDFKSDQKEPDQMSHEKYKAIL